MTVTATAAYSGILYDCSTSLEEVMDLLQGDLNAYRALCNPIGIDVFLEIDSIAPADTSGFPPDDPRTYYPSDASVSGHLVLASEPAKFQSVKQAEMALQADLFNLIFTEFPNYTLSQWIQETAVGELR